MNAPEKCFGPFRQVRMQKPNWAQLELAHECGHGLNGNANAAQRPAPSSVRAAGKASVSTAEVPGPVRHLALRPRAPAQAGSAQATDADARATGR